MSDRVYQIVRRYDGSRSEPFSATEEHLVFALTKSFVGIDEDYMVLVLGENIEGDWRFSRAPYMTVKNFLTVLDGSYGVAS